MAVKHTLDDKITKYSFVEPEVDISPYDNKVAAGYQAFEFLNGFSQVDATSTKYSFDDRISIQRGGLFGHCQNNYPAKFMENLKH